MKKSILAIVLLGSSGVLSNQVLADGFDPWVGASNATDKASATLGPVLGMDGFRPWHFDGPNASQINRGPVLGMDGFRPWDFAGAMAKRRS